MYLKDGAKARNIPCFRWCDQEIVWRSRSQQLKSTNYYMTTTPMSLQRFSLSASALLLSWVKPWPIQTTPASIGSMMMPYGAWTSNVVWSGTVWGTPVNHHLPSKPGNLAQVEAWCVLLSLSFVCLVQELLRFVWFCIVFLPFGSQGACCPAKYSFHHREQNSALKYVRYEGVRSMAWCNNCKKTNRKVEHQVLVSVNSNGWNGKGHREPFCFRFLFAMADTCRMLRPLQQRYEKWPSLVREVANVALLFLRKSSSRRWPRIFIQGSFAIYLELQSNRLMWVKSHCSPILFRGRHCPEESRGQGVFTTRSVWGYKIPKFFPHKSAFEDFPSYIEFEDFLHLDRSLRSGELLVAFGGLSRRCHGMGKC